MQTAEKDFVKSKLMKNFKEAEAFQKEAQKLYDEGKVIQGQIEQLQKRLPNIWCPPPTFIHSEFQQNKQKIN